MLSLLRPAKLTLTTLLVAVNLVIFLVEAAMQGSFTLPNTTEIQRNWGIFAPDIARDNEWWRVFTGGFLHSSWNHMSFNMVFLWILGQPMEKKLGSWKFFLLYFSAVASSSFFAMLFDERSLVIGSSGAVLGLNGAAMVSWAFSRKQALSANNWVLLGCLLSGWATINLAGGVSSSVSFGGHLGGLVCGAVIGLGYYLVAGAFRYVAKRRGTLWVSYGVSHPWHTPLVPHMTPQLNKSEIVVSSLYGAGVGTIWYLLAIWQANRAWEAWALTRIIFF